MKGMYHRLQACSVVYALDGGEIVFGVEGDVAPLDHVDAGLFDEAAQLVHLLPLVVEPRQDHVPDRRESSPVLPPPRSRSLTSAHRFMCRVWRVSCVSCRVVPCRVVIT